MVESQLELQDLEPNTLSLKRPLNCDTSSGLIKSRIKNKSAHKFITIVTSWWEALKIADFSGQVSISNYYDNSVCLTCYFGSGSLQENWNKSWITVQFNKPVFKEDLNISSNFSITRDQSQITIFSASKETLFVDIVKNIQFFEKTVDIQSPMQFTPPTSVNFNWNQLGYCVSKRDIHNQDLQLNKDQVTYLIGKNGSRIERIRQFSNATIKIIPIGRKLSTKELNHPSMVFQSISITGDWYQIALAVALIEANLRLYTLGPRRMLL